MIQKKQDKIFKCILGILFASVIMLPLGYQFFINLTEGTGNIQTKEMQRAETVDGYETPEEVVEYVLYWINQDDLDMALRGCAVEEVAQNFYLESYCEVTDTFPFEEMVAPADNESQAYMQINQARMTAVYSNMLEQCMGIFGLGYNLEVLNISSDIPENADGYYFQDIREICSIIGARDVRDVVVQMRIDGVLREMKVTAARYRRYWKIVQFSEYKNWNYVEPQISEYAESAESKSLPIEWENMSSQILPCNYRIAENVSEKDAEKLLRKWFIYFQRGDIWKAISYCSIYDSVDNIYPNSIFFERQSDMAVELQQLYYKTFLSDEDQLSWILQNVKEEAVNLVSLLDSSNMLYTNLTAITNIENTVDQAVYQVSYVYEGKWFDMRFYMIYDGGWKIERIE